MGDGALRVCVCSRWRPFRSTFWAVGVLQAEAGFMAFSHLGPIEGQQVVVGEDLDAVVVPEEQVRISPPQLPLEQQQQQQQQHKISGWRPFSQLPE